MRVGYLLCWFMISSVVQPVRIKIGEFEHFLVFNTNMSRDWLCFSVLVQLQKLDRNVLSLHAGLFSEFSDDTVHDLVTLAARAVNDTVLPRGSVAIEILSASQDLLNGVHASINGWQISFRSCVLASKIACS